MNCELCITVPLWRNDNMRAKSESSQPCLPESIVTQPSGKPRTVADWLRQKLRLKTSLGFATARFENTSDLGEISQLSDSGCHSTFVNYNQKFPLTVDISWLLCNIPALILRPQNVAPVGRCQHLLPPSYATAAWCLWELSVLFNASTDRGFKNGVFPLIVSALMTEN